MPYRLQRLGHFRTASIFLSVSCSTMLTRRSKSVSISSSCCANRVMHSCTSLNLASMTFLWHFMLRLMASMFFFCSSSLFSSIFSIMAVPSTIFPSWLFRMELSASSGSCESLAACCVTASQRHALACGRSSNLALCVCPSTFYVVAAARVGAS